MQIFKKLKKVSMKLSIQKSKALVNTWYIVDENGLIKFTFNSKEEAFKFLSLQKKEKKHVSFA